MKPEKGICFHSENFDIYFQMLGGEGSIGEDAQAFEKMSQENDLKAKKSELEDVQATHLSSTSSSLFDARPASS